jgi:hypothetical protein
MNRLIGSSPLVTTNNYYTVANLHNLQSLHNNLPILLLATLHFPCNFSSPQLKSSSLQISKSSHPVSGLPYLLQIFGTDHAQKTQPLYCCATSQLGLPHDLNPGRPLAPWLLPSTDQIESFFCRCLTTQLPSNEL